MNSICLNKATSLERICLNKASLCEFNMSEQGNAADIIFLNNASLLSQSGSSMFSAQQCMTSWDGVYAVGPLPLDADHAKVDAWLPCAMQAFAT